MPFLMMTSRLFLMMTSRFEKRSGDIYMVQELLGHRNISTTQKYLGVNYADARAAVEAIALITESDRKKTRTIQPKHLVVHTLFCLTTALEYACPLMPPRKPCHCATLSELRKTCVALPRQSGSPVNSKAHSVTENTARLWRRTACST